jgi:hypothetical protein
MTAPALTPSGQFGPEALSLSASNETKFLMGCFAGSFVQMSSLGQYRFCPCSVPAVARVSAINGTKRFSASADAKK